MWIISFPYFEIYLKFKHLISLIKESRAQLNKLYYYSIIITNCRIATIDADYVSLNKQVNNNGSGSNSDHTANLQVAGGTSRMIRSY